MRVWGSPLIAPALAAALVLGACPVGAQSDQERDRARTLADEGKAALAREDYAAAAALFRRAGALVSAPALELGRARADARPVEVAFTASERAITLLWGPVLRPTRSSTR